MGKFCLHPDPHVFSNYIFQFTHSCSPKGSKNTMQRKQTMELCGTEGNDALGFDTYRTLVIGHIQCRLGWFMEFLKNGKIQTVLRLV